MVDGGELLPLLTRSSGVISSQVTVVLSDANHVHECGAEAR